MHGESVRMCLVSTPTEMKSTLVSTNSHEVSVVRHFQPRLAIEVFHCLVHLVVFEIIQYDDAILAFSA